MEVDEPMSNSPRWGLCVIVLGLVLFVVTACGGGGGQQQQTEQPSTPAKTEEVPLVERGQQLASSIGCTACHSSDGSTIVGPTWKGLFGREVEVVLPDGTTQTVTAGEEYLRESILDPNAKIAKGFQANVMPIYQGQLSEDDIKAIIEYIKSLR